MKTKYISDTALIAAAMAVSLFITGIISAADSEKRLEENLVRLHILADSDSEEDQRLKLLVRDAVLESSEELFEPYQTSAQAEMSLSQKLDRIKEIADDTLAANGSPDTVTCELTEMPFDRREYNSFAVPAGTYTALRITIGSGEGHNWWCVMYPPLCVPCAGADMTDEEIIEKYGRELSEEELLLMSEEADYEARLYIAELIEKLFES
ncbi:MAG: stage II sporulation protein R [Oscillospiraceae bacterium]|nr:stage II sporulation protein R [Oscillospiraceae bacterium]